MRTLPLTIAPQRRTGQYSDPKRFFANTYPTRGLRNLCCPSMASRADQFGAWPAMCLLETRCLHKTLILLDDRITGLPHVGEVLRANARLFPERVGARDLERAMTFRQWNARACRLANALLGLELAKGERVAVLAYNCVEWLEIYAATAKAGLIAVPVNFRLVGAEIRYIVENCEAAAFIVEDALVETVEQVRSDLSVPARNFIHFGAAKCPPGYRAYEDLLAAARDLEPDVKVAPTDPWTLMYTSGTTGTPKGAIRSHLGSANLSLVTEVEMGLARDDAALLVMPLCHGNSFSSAPSSIAAPCGLRAAASIPSSCALALLAGRHLSVVTAVGDALPRAVLEK